MRVIDSHLHFWKLDNPFHGWPDAGWPRLHRDFLPADLPDAEGVVLVQAQPDDRDTDWMLDLAKRDPRVLAVVGWVDLADPAAPARIAQLARHPELRGLRPMLQAESDVDWILRPDLDPAIAAMIAHGLRFDALVEPRHLGALVRFARRWPDLPVVIDHGAKPDATGPAQGPAFDAWRDGIAALAAMPQVHAKLSGLRIQQAPGQPAEALRPYVAHLVAQFGARLMWGSDWPVMLHTGDSYDDWIANAGRLAAPIDMAMLFRGAAARFYGIDI
jgi:L-fuconolactonase